MQLQQVPTINKAGFLMSQKGSASTISEGVTPLRRQRLEKAKKAVVFSGIFVVGCWGLVGWQTGILGVAKEDSVRMKFKRSHTDRGENFKWEDVTPTEDLIYYPCWTDFQCARLEVPLDWSQPKSKDKVAIAILKYPSKVDENSEDWGGPLLVNPGGPGGSGVELAQSLGSQLQTIAGSQFSIIGFDPRGINNTTPPVVCFKSETERKLWNYKTSEKVFGSSSGGEEIGEAYARSKVSGRICEAAVGNEGLNGIAKHVGTPVVARDMLEITERSWIGKPAGNDGKRGLIYWGFSYGSVLGTTFASMFPDRVERLVVDGICDTDDYYSGDLRMNLQDSEKVMESFYTYCSLAGPLRCDFHTGSTPAHIQSRFSSLLSLLQEQPIGVLNSSMGPELATYSDVKSLLFSAMYKPLVLFPKVATILAALEKGDGAPLIESVRENIKFDCTPQKVEAIWSEASSAILCSDASEIDESLEEFKEYVEILRGQSETMGGGWAAIRLGCLGWKIRPDGYTFDRLQDIGGNTSWPLLFVGNSADPVTPVGNARKMVERFGGAVVLEQNSEGHCSIAAPSLCTAKYVGAYFKDGVLPPKNTLCEPDMKPFSEVSGAKVKRSDSELFEAILEIGRKWSPPRWGM